MRTKLFAILALALFPFQAWGLACQIIVGNSGTPTSDDSTLESLIEAHGHSCSFVDDGTAENVTGIDFVVIASSVDEGNVGSKYATITQPMWVDDCFVAIDKFLVSGTCSTDSTVINVISGSNGNAALGGLNSSGNPNTILTSGTIREISTAASGATILADGSDAGFEAYLYVPDGGTLLSGTSPNLRFFIEFIDSGAIGNLNSNGTALVNALIDAIEVEADPSTREQEGFRWGVDDNNEASHGWEASQDTNISIADTQSRLLRVIVNATMDPATAAYTLRYQKNGTGGYVAVPVGATSSPTLTYGATGTIAYSASGGTTVAPTYPTGITTNSCLVLVVGQKPGTANGGTVTTPSGWTLRGSLEEAGGYASTLGADTGNTNVFVYTKDTVTGTETGTLSVTLSDNGVTWANIYRIEASDIATWSYDFGSGSDTSAGSVSIATGSMTIAAGDHIIAGMVIPTDVTTPAQFSAESLTQTSTTFGTVNEVQEPDSTVGNDIGGFIVEAGVSSGGASGAVTLAATAGGTTTNVRGPGFVLRVRATAVNHQTYITTSGNIAAGGEATTARLTAPSGKSTSDFVCPTNCRWDNENGSDSIDITTDDYTEVEWLVALSADPVSSDYFEYRVYAGASALNTYTVTPRWTVPSAGGVKANPMSGQGGAAATPVVLGQ